MKTDNRRIINAFNLKQGSEEYKEFIGRLRSHPLEVVKSFAEAAAELDKVAWINTFYQTRKSLRDVKHNLKKTTIFNDFGSNLMCSRVKSLTKEIKMIQKVNPKKDAFKKAVSNAYSATGKLLEKHKHKIFQNWGAEAKALDKLKEKSNNCWMGDRTSLLIMQCSTVNTLYGIRLRSSEIIPWAKRLESFFKDYGTNPTVEEVEEELRKKEPQGARHGYVFIPKFFHFFVDQKKYPILDSFACIAVGVILHGKKMRSTVSYVKYTEYTKEIAKMVGLNNNSGKFRKIDPFLWVAGHYWSDLPKKSSWRDLFKPKEDNNIKELVKNLDKINDGKKPEWLENA